MAVTANPGLVLTLNEKEIALAPKDVTDAKTKGVHLELAEKVDLGRLADVGAFVTNTFGGSAPKEADLPPPLSTIYHTLTNLDLTIENFTLDIPPADANGNAGPMTFSLGMSALLPGAGVDIIPGKLAIKGIYLQITKDASP